MDSQQVWWTREPGSDRVPAALQSRSLQRASRHSNLRRRIHLLPDGFAANLSRRAGVRDEVGHGLDARYAAVLQPGSDSSPVPPQQIDLSHALFVPRKLRFEIG